MSKGKRKSMDDVLASMGGMKATRPAPEPEPVEESVSGAPAVPEKRPKGSGTGTPLTMYSNFVAQLRETGEIKPEEAEALLVQYAEVHGTAEKIAPPVAPDPELRPVEPIKRGSASTRARAHVRKEEVARQTRPASVPRGYNVRPPRIEKPHQSIYADPAVWKVVRQIALVEDVKPQDLYREALRLMLKKRGYDFDKLDRGEA